MKVLIYNLILFLQQSQNIDVNEKLKNAPDDSYQTGIIIGSLLPFVLLMGIAWFVYYKAKNRKDLD